MHGDLDETTDGFEAFDELAALNPVRPVQLGQAVAIDRGELAAMLRADAGDDRAGLGSARAGRSSTATRVGYVGAGLLVAAVFAGIAMVGIRDLTDRPIVPPADGPAPSIGDETTPVLEVPGRRVEQDSAGRPADAATGRSSGPSEPDPAVEGAPIASDPSCTAEAATLADARAAYAAGCAAPRADCDEIDGRWVCASEILGARGPAGTDEAQGGPPDRPMISGPFDPESDLLSVHHDNAPNRDDALATVAARELAGWLRITPHVINGAYGTNADRFDPASTAVMDATWGDSWLDAHADRVAAVQRTAERWLATIDDGGDVWVAEGGQSNLTAAVVRAIEARRPDLDTGDRIHVVQHSRWNEDNTDPDDLATVRSATDYIRIDNGNSLNGTADLRRASPAFVAAATAGPNGPAWEAALAFFGTESQLDFSDAVSILHIFGIGVDRVADPDDFARLFLG